jgi:hypothetical protein
MRGAAAADSFAVHRAGADVCQRAARSLPVAAALGASGRCGWHRGPASAPIIVF